MSISAGTSLNAFDYDFEANKALSALVESLDVILNCMLILNYPKSQSLGPAAASDASRSILLSSPPPKAP